MNLRLCILLTAMILTFSACQSALLSLFAPGEVLFRDDFSTPDSGWMQAEPPEGSMGYREGVFQITVNQPGAQLWSQPGLRFADVLVEVDARKVSGSDDNLFGVACRLNDTGDFYAFLVSSDGYYGIARARSGQLQVLGDGALLPSEAILQGESNNRLVAECHRNLLVFSVNGQALVELQVDQYPAGDVGLIAGSASPSGATIAFDNLVVRRP